MDVRHKITVDIWLKHCQRCGAKNYLYFLTLYVGSSLCKSMCFSVLKSQTRHQNGDTHFLTLDEILDETKLLDISMKQKQWLMNEVCLYFLNTILPIVYHTRVLVLHYFPYKLIFPQSCLYNLYVAAKGSH